MAVISFISSKGGTGKTTSALILAGELAQTGEKITILDADPNEPIKKWASLQDKPDNINVVVDKSEDTIQENIETAKKNSKIVIIDVEGSANMRISYSIAYSDLALIPVKASILDAEQAINTIKLIKINKNKIYIC